MAKRSKKPSGRDVGAVFDNLMFMRRWFMVPGCFLAWVAFLIQVSTGDYSSVAAMLTLGVAFTYGWVFWLPNFVNRITNGR
jgi:hypothetical protein